MVIRSKMKLRDRLKQNVIEPKKKGSAADFSSNTARELTINNAKIMKDYPSFNESRFKMEENHKVTVKIKSDQNLNIRSLESPSQDDKNALKKVDSIDFKVKLESTTNFRAPSNISSGIQ